MQAVTTKASARSNVRWWISISVASAALITWSISTPNVASTALAFLSLFVAVASTRRADEPPVLTFICIMQWLQAGALLLYANVHHIRLVDSFVGPELEAAVRLSLIGIIALAVGIRVSLFRCDLVGGGCAAESDVLVPSKIFIAYLVALFASEALRLAALAMPPIAQPLLAAASLKWVFVFLLTYVSLQQQRGLSLLAMVVVVELIIGLIGFFSGFKTVLFILLVAALGQHSFFRGRRLLFVTLTGAVALVMGSAWQAVKGDYRDFLNQGYQTQEVSAPVADRIMRLGELVQHFDADQLVQGFNALVMRVSYVEFFSLVIKNVPTNVPYEDGALWSDAVKRVFMPRVLFPSKPSVDDSERTAYYSGAGVAGTAEGTSISIGYFGESYIDFGPVIMFGPITVLGICYGVAYRMFVARTKHPLLGVAVIAQVLILNATTIETSNIKVVGGFSVSMLVSAVFYLMMQRWGLRHLVDTR